MHLRRAQGILTLQKEDGDSTASPTRIGLITGRRRGSARTGRDILGTFRSVRHCTIVHFRIEMSTVDEVLQEGAIKRVFYA